MLWGFEEKYSIQNTLLIPYWKLQRQVRERDRQTDRQTDTDRETDRDRQTDRQRHRGRDRHRDRENKGTQS